MAYIKGLFSVMDLNVYFVVSIVYKACLSSSSMLAQQQKHVCAFFFCVSYLLSVLLCCDRLQVAILPAYLV